MFQTSLRFAGPCAGICLALGASACGDDTEEPATTGGSAGNAATSSSSGPGTGGGGSSSGAGGDACPGPDPVAPLLHYAFDGDAKNAGSLGATYDGVASDVSYAEGKIGQAVKFAGPACTGPAAPAPNVVSLPGTATVLASLPKVTIGLWYREDPPPDTGCVMYLLDCRSATRGFHTYQGATMGELTTCYTAATEESCSSSPSTTGEWHHVLYRYDGTSTSDGGGAPLEIWVDGQLAKTMDTGGFAIFGEGIADLTVGKFGFFEIDELKVFDQVFDDEGQCTQVMGGKWCDGSCVLP